VDRPQYAIRYCGTYLHLDEFVVHSTALIIHGMVIFAELDELRADSGISYTEKKVSYCHVSAVTESFVKMK
jgi:hypothetical protein